MSETDELDEGGGDAYAGASASMASETTGAGCLSCGAPLIGVFCVACGQKQDDLRRSLLLLARNFVEDTFSFDGRMWRTLALLVSTPGRVPSEFSHGKRSPFTPPVRLFLVVSFLFFLTIGLTNTLFVGIEVVFNESDPVEIAAAHEKAADAGVLLGENTAGGNCSFQGQLRFFVKEKDLSTDIGRVNACIAETQETVNEGIETGAGAAEFEEARGDLNEAQAAEIVDRVFKGIRWTVTNPREFNDAFNDWLPRVMFFMTPVLALILSLFLRRRALIFDHMVLSLYLHAVNFAIVGGALILAQLGLPLAGVPAGIAIVVYYVAALKRAYGRGWVKTIWTAFGSSAIYALIFSTILLTIVSRIVWMATA